MEHSDLITGMYWWSLLYTFEFYKLIMIATWNILLGKKVASNYQDESANTCVMSV